MAVGAVEAAEMAEPAADVEDGHVLSPGRLAGRLGIRPNPLEPNAGVRVIRRERVHVGKAEI